MANPFRTITDAIAVMSLFGADPLETRKTVQGATYPFPWGNLKKGEDPDSDYDWQEDVLTVTVKKVYDPEVDFVLDVYMTMKGFNMLTRLMKVAHLIKIDKEFGPGYILYAVELDKNFKITTLEYTGTEATEE